MNEKVRNLNDYDRKIYRALQKSLDKNPIGYPKTRTGVDILILMGIFEPIEAYISSFLDWKFNTLDIISERVKSGLKKENDEFIKYTGIIDGSIDEVKKHLDSVVEKGGILKQTNKGDPQYALVFLLLGMYELQVNRLTMDLFDNFAQIEKEGFMREYLGVHRQQYRIIPVEESLTHSNIVMPHEKLTHFINQSEGPFAVFKCVCKTKYEMKGHPCEKTDRREVCLTFGSKGNAIINSKVGREISKEEALSILRQNVEDGLEDCR